MEVHQLLNIHKTTTSPYWPQCDGRNENSHKFIFKIAKVFCETQLEAGGMAGGRIQSSLMTLRHADLSSPLQKLCLHHPHLLRRTMLLIKAESRTPKLRSDFNLPVRTGYLCLIMIWVIRVADSKSPNDDINDENGKKRGTKRKKAPAVPSWRGWEVNGKFRLFPRDLSRM